MTLKSVLECDNEKKKEKEEKRAPSQNQTGSRKKPRESEETKKYLTVKKVKKRTFMKTNKKDVFSGCVE